MPTPTRKLDYALDALARGLRVFPQDGKRPKIRDWPNNATDKASVVERWWTRWPDADIGIALSPDLYVFDTDSPEALDALRDLGLPRTLMVETARGRHYYFRVPHQLARMPGGGEGLRAVEGKGSPGPVTWAGSIHAGTGARYEILVDAPIANMPRALVEAIGPKRDQQFAGDVRADERALWAERHTGISLRAAPRAPGPATLLYAAAARLGVADARADLALVLRALRCELPDMPSGWADRFFRAGAYLGPHVACGALDLDTAIQELTTVFHDLDTDGGDPGHVLRSIERGIAMGARESGL